MGGYSSTTNYIKSDVGSIKFSIQLSKDKYVINTFTGYVEYTGECSCRVYKTYCIKDYINSNLGLYNNLKPGKYSLVIRKIDGNTAVISSLRLTKSEHDPCIVIKNYDNLNRNKYIKAFDISQKIRANPNHREKYSLLSSNKNMRHISTDDDELEDGVDEEIAL